MSYTFINQLNHSADWQFQEISAMVSKEITSTEVAYGTIEDKSKTLDCNLILLQQKNQNIMHLMTLDQKISNYSKIQFHILSNLYK